MNRAYYNVSAAGSEADLTGFDSAPLRDARYTLRTAQRPAGHGLAL